MKFSSKIALKSVAFAALVLTVFTACQEKESPQFSFNQSAVLADLNYLASDELGGRETGTMEEELAAAYIANRFDQLGLQAAGEEGYYQSFSKKPHPPIQKMNDGDSTRFGMGVVKEITGKNVIAKFENQSDSWIVIGAHYDHLGMGDENSLHTEGHAIHNGADDNASGVALMLSLAEDIQALTKNSNVLFIAFSGEEKGLWGSNTFCDKPTIPLDQVKCMINFDMVGRMNEENTLAIYGNGTSPAWNSELEMANKDSLKLVLSESGVGPSDHTSFYLEDIPVLHLFTGQHEDYHRPSDDVEKINMNGMKLVNDYTARLIQQVDQLEQMAFTKTKDEDNESAPAFKVTLGVIPDYLFDGEGMRIDGLREERPAQNAGMMKGDVVVQMGELKVTDMQSYMEGLSIFEPEDTTLVSIIRDGEAMELEVIWD